MTVFDTAHVPATPSRHVAGLPPGQTLALPGPCPIGPNESDASPPLRTVIKRLPDGELLVLASRTGPAQTLRQYRKRWKRRGFC